MRRLVTASRLLRSELVWRSRTNTNNTFAGYFFRTFSGKNRRDPMRPSDSDEDGDGDGDGDLKAAIAMSLASSASITDRETDSNSEQVSSPSKSNNNNDNNNNNGKNNGVPKMNGLSGIAGLDRKAMERERLARQKGKRERSVSPPALRSPRKALRLDAAAKTAGLGSLAATVQQDQKGRKSDVANAATERLKTVPMPQQTPKDDLRRSKDLPKLAYPQGVVKRTWALGHSRSDDDVKIEEVLEPLTLRTAILSAFQWDTSWILSKLRPGTKCVFVMQGKDPALREQMLSETANVRGALRLCFPPMEGQTHCMHSKLMLLFHPHKLRIAIPTANLLAFDWGETGTMENCVFVVDLPRLPSSPSANRREEDLTDFGKELLYFLTRQTLDADIRAGILNFDFAATRDMAFVHTVGGVSLGNEKAGRTGFPGLGRAVRELGLETARGTLEIDFAASSIGSLNESYLREFYKAARGEESIPPSSSLGSGTATSKADFFAPKSKTPSSSTTTTTASKDEDPLKENFRIYFPTSTTVEASTAGAAGTICINRKWFEAPTFPRHLFRDYVSTRKGLLSHNKILFARGRSPPALKDKGEGEGSGGGRGADGAVGKGGESEGGKEGGEGEGGSGVAWAYVGSANMSESAWGKLVWDKKLKVWKLVGRNWECGVLLPVRGGRKMSSPSPSWSLNGKQQSEPGTEEEEEEEASKEIPGMGVFDGIVPRPFEYPAQRFGEREPWYFLEQRGDEIG